MENTTEIIQRDVKCSESAWCLNIKSEFLGVISCVRLRLQVQVFKMFLHLRY